MFVLFDCKCSDLGDAKTNIVRINEGLVNLKIRIYKENRYFQKGKSIIESAAPNTFTSNVVCCASMEDTSLGLIVTASMYTVVSSSITLDCRSVSTGELYTGWANIQVIMVGF